MPGGAVGCSRFADGAALFFSPRIVLSSARRTAGRAAPGPERLPGRAYRWLTAAVLVGFGAGWLWELRRLRLSSCGRSSFRLLQPHCRAAGRQGPSEVRALGGSRGCGATIGAGSGPIAAGLLPADCSVPSGSTLAAAALLLAVAGRGVRKTLSGQMSESCRGRGKDDDGDPHENQGVTG